MPAPRKRAASRGKASGRNRKSKVDYHLFILSTLILILFALIAALVLTLRPPVGEDLFTSAESPPQASPEAAPEKPSPSPRTVGPSPSPGGPEESPETPSPAPTSPRPSPAPSRRPSPRPSPRPAAGELVIVIDDVGHNVHDIKPFLDFPGELTFAVLPGLPHTADCVKMLQAAGREYILHLPMEAIDDLDPGPGALTGDPSPAEIHAILVADLADVPGARGINNHMGSKFTQDLGLMRQVLRFAKSRGLYFIDSKTISGTVTSLAAELEGYTAWERDVFLDNASDKASIRAMLNQGLAKASASGRAVMIGHVWSANLAQALMELYPELVEEGYSLTTISRIMRNMDDDGSGD
jgi:polysaccharide deacetylase 2 family uncharacterized protein YibQ